MSGIAVGRYHPFLSPQISFRRSFLHLTAPKIVRTPKRLCRSIATLHTSGGSVDRNDAASTGPLVQPRPQILLEEAVRLQMDALACNDEPRADHGLEVMYYFANTEGPLLGGSLPTYFGFPSDLYHFGHFALKFKTRYPELINHVGYDVRLKTAENRNEGSAIVTVKGKSGNDDSTWMFTMSKQARGQQLPIWITTSLRKHSDSGTEI